MERTERSWTHQHRIEILVGSFFVGAIVATNVIASKLMTLWGTTFTVGALVYPFTFLCTDVLSEVFGKATARFWVWMGFFASLVVLGFITLGGLVAESEFSKVGDCYGIVFAGTPRIVLGSMLAYLASQQTDVVIFHWVRKLTKAKHLWLRNNVATSLSQGLDTSIFCVVAFAWEVPFGVLMWMILGQYLIKVLMALADTPICYLAVWGIRRAAFGKEARV